MVMPTIAPGYGDSADATGDAVTLARTASEGLFPGRLSGGGDSQRNRPEGFPARRGAPGQA